VKILTILGTRPEIIRLSRIIPELDRFTDHRLVHTGQNFDERLSALFFQELGVRAPDHHLGITGSSFGTQAGLILERAERVLVQERPDRVLILGDTNSALAAIVAKRMGIPVFHMEAGNRCHDDRVPEEVNRRIVDHCSDVLLPYTERSRENLLREGIPSHRIHVTGNPIGEVIAAHRDRIDTSAVLQDLSLQPQGYLLATLHRAENVDEPQRLGRILQGLATIARHHGRPVIASTHPRLRARLASFGLTVDDRIRLLPPFGFFDFLRLERDAFCVLSDSGTVQEECALLGVASVTLRDVTERPETQDCGANMLAGDDPATLLRATQVAVAYAGRWQAPPEYQARHVSATVVRLLTSYRHGLVARDPA
jgi:UDP-N-acetylglucosamine 2-epimerase (non-hydrolysing)